MAKQAAPLNPLTVNDIAGAKAGKTTAQELIDYWHRCTKCTMDTGPLIEQAESLIKLFDGVVSEFGGNASGTAG